MSSRKDRQSQIIESQNQYIQELRERNGQLVRPLLSFPPSSSSHTHASIRTQTKDVDDQTFEKEETISESSS